MDIDKMQQSWSALNDRLSRLETENAAMVERVIRGKASSSLGTFRRHCAWGCWLIPLLIPYFVLCLAVLDIDMSHPQFWGLSVTGLLFVAVTEVREILLYRMARCIDIASMPVVEALERSVRLRKAYYLGVAVALVFLVPFVSELCIAVGDVPGADVGMVVGAVAGLVIGTVIFMFYRRKLRQLEQALGQWHASSEE